MAGYYPLDTDHRVWACRPPTARATPGRHRGDTRRPCDELGPWGIKDATRTRRYAKLQCTAKSYAVFFSGKRQTDHTDGNAYVPFTG